MGAAERGLRGRGSRRKGWSWRDTQHGEGLSFTGEEEWGKEAGRGRQRKCRGGTEPRRSPYQWAAGGGVARLRADGSGRRALESSCDCDRALRLLSLVGLAVEPAYPGTGRRAAGREAWAWGSGGVSWAEEGLRERGCCCEGEEEMGVMGARQALSQGEAEGEREGGGQSEGWPHSRGCSGPEQTRVKVGPRGRVRLC